ncbi:MAG: hypothetical protein ACR2NX_07180 [Chthoniobacterales bacterium]
MLRTDALKALLLTNEYPPHVYGGAGVHVEYLSRELPKRMPVEVRCLGEQESDPNLKRASKHSARKKLKKC